MLSFITVIQLFVGASYRLILLAKDLWSKTMQAKIIIFKDILFKIKIVLKLTVAVIIISLILSIAANVSSWIN